MGQFELMKNEYVSQYQSDAQKGDEQAKNIIGLFENAEALSDKAKAEFFKAFKVGFEYALEGKLYLGSEHRAKASYPNLFNEGAQAGIEFAWREEND